MRRHRQQLSAAECRQLLERCTSGVLALLGDGGYPYAVPLSYAYADGRLYFHSALEGHKVDAISACNKCSFCVIDRDEVHPAEFTTHYRSVIAFGHVSVIDDPAVRLEAIRLIGRRYSPHDAAGLQREIDKGMSRVLLLRLDIEHLSGKQAIELVGATAHGNNSSDIIN